MDKLKSLLLPLALVFGAIAVFEFGARYGAANMRAYAIASELQLPIKIYTQGQTSMDPTSKEAFAMLIDNGIAAGALQLDLWYVSKESKAALQNTISEGLSLRGDATIERFQQVNASEETTGQSKTRIQEILAALEKVIAKFETSQSTAAEPAS
ncbi:MAG: hypothetical protein AAGC73_07215 [Verrucomicrobiota bacterium]